MIETTMPVWFNDQDAFFDCLIELSGSVVEDPFYSLKMDQAKRNIEDGQVFDDAYKNKWLAEEMIALAKMAAVKGTGMEDIDLAETLPIYPSMRLRQKLYLKLFHSLMNCPTAFQEANVKAQKEKTSPIAVLNQRALEICRTVLLTLPWPDPVQKPVAAEVDLPEMDACEDNGPSTTP